MKSPNSSLLGLTLLTLPLLSHAQPALTIYNDNFALVRDRVPLDLKKGSNAVNYSGATTALEADSVVLRDPSRATKLSILEQSYRGDAVSPGLLLSLFHGKELDFLQRDANGHETITRGKVIRSGYRPGQPGEAAGMESPIIEVEGQLRFSLPGEPLFPSLGSDTILDPTLSWKLASDRDAKFDAELSYLTGGLSWQASYNLIAPENSDTVDLVGWISIQNNSGKTFDNAGIKLLAGKVQKIQPGVGRAAGRGGDIMAMALKMDEAPAVTEKAFDEFHLYSLPLATTLHNRETKQVEFMRGAGIHAPTIYQFQSMQTSAYGDNDFVRYDPNFGIGPTPKVAVLREFKNTKENGLGLPMPEGRIRFYREDDDDKRPEFTGENNIEHTPQGETLRIKTGESFDIVAERKRTDFKIQNNRDQAEEEFEITLRNRKKTAVEVRVIEKLYRGLNWEVIERSDAFEKRDSQTIEFRILVQPDEEKKTTYRVRYDWK